MKSVRTACLPVVDTAGVTQERVERAPDFLTVTVVDELARSWPSSRRAARAVRVVRLSHSKEEEKTPPFKF